MTHYVTVSSVDKPRDYTAQMYHWLVDNVGPVIKQDEDESYYAWQMGEGWVFGWHCLDTQSWRFIIDDEMLAMEFALRWA